MSRPTITTLRDRHRALQPAHLRAHAVVARDLRDLLLDARPAQVKRHVLAIHQHRILAAIRSASAPRSRWRALGEGCERVGVVGGDVLARGDERHGAVESAGVHVEVAQPQGDALADVLLPLPAARRWRRERIRRGSCVSDSGDSMVSRLSCAIRAHSAAPDYSRRGPGGR